MLHEEIKRHLPPDIKNKWKHDPHHYPLDILHECLPKDQRFLVKRFLNMRLSETRLTTKLHVPI